MEVKNDSVERLSLISNKKNPNPVWEIFEVNSSICLNRGPVSILPMQYNFMNALLRNKDQILIFGGYRNIYKGVITKKNKTKKKKTAAAGPKRTTNDKYPRD